MKAGSGNKPTPYDKVTVNYRGTFIDGTEFDSSYKRNQPATFAVNGVIPGWREVLPLMKTGSKWRIRPIEARIQGGGGRRRRHPAECHAHL